MPIGSCDRKRRSIEHIASIDLGAVRDEQLHHIPTACINPRQQISYFLDRLLGVDKLWFEDGELKRKPLLGGDATTYPPAGNGKFRSPETGRTAPP